ncbi:MAG: hypothetical protein AAFY98_03600 [Verrucomicrobiota bacterium]
MKIWQYSLILLISLISSFSLTAEETAEPTSSNSSKTSISDLVPEMPESQPDFDPTPEWAIPGDQANEFDMSDVQQEFQSMKNKRELRFTEEDLEKIKKEKNWLVEEWKAYEQKRAAMEIELAAGQEQTLIEEILKQQEEVQKAELEKQKSDSTGVFNSFEPALPAVSINQSDVDPELFESMGKEDPFNTGIMSDPSNTSQPTEFISPNSPLLSDQTTSAPAQNGRLTLEPTPNDSLSSQNPTTTMNTAFTDAMRNASTNPTAPDIYSNESGSGGQPLQASTPSLIPQQAQFAQQQLYADRIDLLRQQEEARQQQLNENKPTVKDFNPVYRQLRGDSRFN